MRDIVIYRDAANEKAPFGIILDDVPSYRDHENSRCIGVAEQLDLGDSMLSSELPQELLELGLEGQIVPVSISHDKDYAVATALVPTI